MRPLRALPPLGPKSGLTLIELMLASLLAAMVMAGLFRLLDLTLDLWSRGETRRTVVERSSHLLELLREDLVHLHGGQSGDLLIDWAPLDADGDGLPDRVLPRLRLVRQASGPELQRLFLRDLDADQLVQLRGEGDPDVVPPAPGEPAGLVETCWVVLPVGGKGEARFEAAIWRGERRIDDDQRASCFEPNYLQGGEPPVGAVERVAGGVLWLGVQCATQTSVVRQGWNVGPGLADACTSWDAWVRGRPDPDETVRNLPGAGMPAAASVPHLPRRVRLELELEGPEERKRRTFLTASAQPGETTLRVDDDQRLPPVGGHVLIAGEWMEVLGVRTGTLRVRRGVRETVARTLPEGARVHFGAPVVTEVSIPLYNDVWTR